jgi:hypothetical protein
MSNNNGYCGIWSEQPAFKWIATSILVTQAVIQAVSIAFDALAAIIDRWTKDK